MKKNSQLRSIYRLLADHPNAKYCIHDIQRIYNMQLNTASSMLSNLVRRGGATKTFREFCDTQQKYKHYHYRYLGKVKTNGKHAKPKKHKIGYGAVSRHLQQKVNELQSENRKLKVKVDALKEMLRDEWTNE